VKKLAVIACILLSQSAFAQLDSLNISIPSLRQDTLATLTNKLDSIEASTREKVDSVTQYYNQEAAKLQEFSLHYQQKIDSLGHLKLPIEKYTKKLDSLGNKMIEVKQNVEGKIHSIKKKATEKLNSVPLPPELKAKVLELTSSLDKVSLNGLTSGINSPINVKDIDTSIDQIIPSTDLNGITNISSDLTYVNIPDLSKNLGSVSDLTSGVSGQVSTLQNSAGEITQGATNVNNLDKLAESQAMRLDVVKDFTKETGNLPSASTLMPTEEQAKQQVLEQAQSIAVNHFAGKQELLQSAMDKVGKYKAKYESLPSVDDLPKRLFFDLKGKPFIERIVPGIQFQILSKQGNLLVDFNAYAGYRLTSKFTSGLGWNQRVAYNKDMKAFNADARIYGPRAFTEYRLGRGFLPRVEFEVMNTAIPPYTSARAIDSNSREWVMTAFVGMKKEYRFIKNVKGTTTIMLNAYHPHNKNLYSDVMNVRFGFEFPMKEKLKKLQSN
jgi:hypothetical protein